jgi:selenocysteine-specific translation elongation factor
MGNAVEPGTERVFNIGILGGNHEITKLVGESLGSPSDKSDLQFFNRLDGGLGYIFNAVDAVAYPEKLKSLLQACMLSNIHIMVIDAETGITPIVGEVMVAMDLFARNFGSKPMVAIGNITGATEWRVEEIKQKFPKIAKGTLLEQLPIYTLKERGDFDALKKKIVEIGLSIPLPDPTTAPYAKVLIDHAFPVKGVGTVILGVVKQGQVTAGEMYDITPVQKKVILRSIQKQDRDFKTAVAGDRVGLALKGVNHEDIDRNATFTSLNAYSASKQFQGKLTISPYYKPPEGSISSSNTRQYYITADLAVSPVKFTAGDTLKPGESGVVSLTSEKLIPHDPQGIKGIIADFGPFENKLRIVGYFSQN